MAAPGGSDLESLFSHLRKIPPSNNSTSAPSPSNSNTFANQQQFHQNQGRSTPQTANSNQPYFSMPFLSQASPQYHGYHQPVASSPIVSPPPTGPQPHHQSAIMSPNIASGPTTPAPSSGTSNADRTAGLLNLLKFSQPQSAPQNTSATPPAQQPANKDTLRPAHGTLQNLQAQEFQPQGRAISASDLVASFMGKPSTPAGQKSSTASPAPSKPELSRAESSASPAENPQDFLLKLLNRPKPSQTETTSVQQPNQIVQSSGQQPSEAVVDQVKQDSADALHEMTPTKVERNDTSEPGNRKKSPVRVFGRDENSKPTPFEMQPKKSSMFTYVNPFEQLAASSPRNRTPRPESVQTDNILPSVETPLHNRTARLEVSGDSTKRKSKEPSPGPAHATTRRRLHPNSNEQLPTNPETVSEALSEVGGRVDKQVEAVLGKVDPPSRIDNTVIKQEALERDEDAALQDLENKVQSTAADVKKELDKEDNKDVLEESMPKPVADAVKELLDEAAHGNVADSWESAEGEESPVKDEENQIIRVYNFPLKPFVSIDIKPQGKSSSPLRDDAIMDIARLKKEFDQVDRTLATSTNSFIVYAMSKNGGFRVIRQSDGKDKQIFRTTQDRIFNLAISTAASGSPLAGTETIVGTGVSGSVYWVRIADSSEDIFGEDGMEGRGLIFPPVPAHDDNTSGGQLKTRAKKSSRHPEYFAIGRGKSIHIVWPQVAGLEAYLKDTKARLVDGEKYFKERSAKINTGKAGKDFTFSEDDSVIVSLDKAGRMRFWDVRALIEEADGTNAKNVSAEVKIPIMTLQTTSPAEKAWPTSLLFVDKLRPYSKGTALRYIIVGMKQNHTLQLWDLGLGKAVQEINFPHEKESDAICSIAYHASSGIIVVAHPTRNSIFFVHLSAPRYNLTAMYQSKYCQRLASKDSTLPKPENTAIMSGLREVSFSSKGQIRSLDMLFSPASAASGTDPEDQVIFELYVMHSKGVTCLSIRKEDLGWDKCSRVIHPFAAEEEGIIDVKELRDAAPAPQSESASVNGDHTAPVSTPVHPPTAKTTPKALPKTNGSGISRSGELQSSEVAPTVSNHAKTEGKQDTTKAGTVNGTPERSEKKKKKRAAANDTAARSTEEPAAPTPAPATASSYANVAQRAKSPQPPTSPAPSKATSRSQAPKDKLAVPDASEATTPLKQTQSTQSAFPSESVNVGISGDFLDKELKKIEKGVSAEFSRVIMRELDALYRRFDEDKRVQDAAGAAKQDAILRLVSSTLSDNVEKTLARIVGTNIQQVVLPSIADITTTTLDRRLAEVVTHTVHQILPQALKVALASEISRALQTTEVMQTISDLVSTKIAGQVEREFSTALHNTISPAFKTLVINAAQKMGGELERRVGEQLTKADAQRHNDSLKIDQLTTLVRGLSETVHTMAAAQSDFQHEILKLQRQVAQPRQPESGRSTSSQQRATSTRTEASLPTQIPQKTPEQEDLEMQLEAVAAMMNEGKYEEGTIFWLQSNRQAELFDQFFVRCSANYIQHLTPLVALSVSAAVTSSLENFIMERLNWLETVFATINPRDNDIIEVSPKIMDVLSQRLESLYMKVAESNPQDPILRKIPPLTRQARELKSFGR
ncbi:MAG: hypothetical protein M1812_005065 [Candelaria pacifica]|nr:MAG: hypothetical protein M1812_005065 [Candelaria pacifica]